MYIALGVISVLMVAGVVFITEGQRNIPVIYAKSSHGSSMGAGRESTLPLRVNMAGVVPIIFAVSLVLFPPMIAQFFVHAKSAWLANAAQSTISFFQNQTIYAVLFFLLVFGFTYFYTAIVFQPERAAENIQKQGGYIPGIRPGNPTAEYLMWVINRITPAGALFLGVIAVLPVVLQNYTGSQALAIGGTGLLIVVSVVIEIINQVQARITSQEYERV
jgi:preprotein translocase subunit SecY